MSIWSRHQKVLLVGMGEQAKLTHKVAPDGGAKTFAGLAKSHGKNLTVRFAKGCKVVRMIAFAEGMMLRDHKFEECLSKDDKNGDDATPYHVAFQASSRHTERLRAGCNRAARIAKGVQIARDLSNQPGNKLYPMGYAARARGRRGSTRLG